MRLSNTDLLQIARFFNNSITLRNLFVNVYETEMQYESNLIFDIGDGAIIGFKRRGERFIAYVGKNFGQYYIKFNSGIKYPFAENNAALIISEIKKNAKSNTVFSSSSIKEGVKFLSENQDENILDVSGDILDEQALNNVASNAFDEEVDNLEKNIEILEDELQYLRNHLPYPSVGKYDTATDYDEIDDLQAKKRANENYWIRIEETDKYVNADSLYKGHVNSLNRDYYFLDSYLPSKKLTENSVLVAVDDRSYKEIFNKWKYPKKNDGVNFSRNITIKHREIEDVQVVYDDSNSFFSSISDLFLRNALIKNKSNVEMQSIIQTIQEKQNEIRTFDENSSLIVQGCAGSGKTMVLLHRLKYLKFNKVINSDNFVLLVPNNNFKSFIKKIANEFGIYDENIFSYVNYYRTLLGKNNDKNFVEEDELNFSSEYLSRVYSKDLILECYSYLTEIIDNAVNELIDQCDAKLNELIKEEKLQATKSTDLLKKQCVDSINESLGIVRDILGISPLESFNDCSAYIENLKERYVSLNNIIENKISEVKKQNINPEQIALSIRDNRELNEIQQEIDAERDRISKASIFTVLAHKRKLSKLTDKFDKIKKEIIDKIQSDETEYKNKTIEELKHIGVNYTIDQFGQNISQAEKFYSDNLIKINNNEVSLKELNNNCSKKYDLEIKAIQELIDISTDFADVKDNAINDLVPLNDILFKYLHKAISLLTVFTKHESFSFKINSDLRILLKKSDAEIYAFAFRTIFNKCKKILKDEFDIMLCKSYKHYWYLYLYFTYLLKGTFANAKKFTFIDEAQDLAVSEIDLIYRCNRNSNPIINLFGDINQVISNYGIKSWATMPFAKNYFELNENFRNTNQIIDYCNKAFSYNMVPVGVSMSEVKEYNDIDSFLTETQSQELVFIVKDEYAYDDVENMIKNHDMKDYKLFTVKNVKGLEFKEVTVFDAEMSIHEKYIACTRALMQLNIIKTIEQSGDHESKIIQGDDSIE